MGRERSYEDIVRKGQEKRYLAYARSEEEKAEIAEWLERVGTPSEPIEPEIDEEVRRLFEILYRNRVLTFKQYWVLQMGNVEKLSREQIRKKTGRSAGALRKIIHDAKQSLKRKCWWDKYRSLCDF
jgi:hypothetical protein